MSDLVKRSDALRDWSALARDERKRRAARALQERDLDELWGLTEAHLKLHGRKGAKVGDLTLRAYRFALGKLLEAWEGESLLKIDPDAAQLHVRELERGRRDPEDEDAWLEPPLKPATVVKRVAAARHFYGALAWAGLVTANPFERVRVASDPERPEDKREAYTLDEVKRLFETARAEGDPVTLLTLLLTVLAGLRASEVVALRWEDVDLDAGLIRVVGKGDKPRFAPVADLLAVELVRYRRSRRDASPFVLVRSYRGVGPYTDQALRERVEALCRRAVDPRTGRPVRYKALHSFRHTFGNEMQKLISLLDLQLILGHTDVKTTSIYGLSTSEKAAARARGAGRGGSITDDDLLRHRDEGVNALSRVIDP